jgi:hypothetical protein
VATFLTIDQSFMKLERLNRSKFPMIGICLGGNLSAYLTKVFMMGFTKIKPYNFRMVSGELPDHVTAGCVESCFEGIYVQS